MDCDADVEAIRAARRVVEEAEAERDAADAAVAEYRAEVAEAEAAVRARCRADERDARLARATETLAGARRAEAETGMRLLVAAMDELFRASEASALDARRSLSRDWGVELVCFDYGGATSFVEQFGVFADKFRESGFAIPTLTFAVDESEPVYVVRDVRRCSAGEEWRLELRVLTAILGEPERLFASLRDAAVEARGRASRGGAGDVG